MTAAGGGGQQGPLVFLIAGEPSGDQLGAGLMAALKSETGGRVRFTGLGGPRMAGQGLESLFPIDELAVMGIVEVLPHVLSIYRRIRQTRAAARAAQPDILVTIDSPSFTLEVSQRLKGEGFPLVHYVAPSVWAWKPWRARQMARYLDHLLALLPFEPPQFEPHGLITTFVGHPAVEAADRATESGGFRAAHDIPEAARLLCLLPGSRRGEVRRLLPVFGETLAVLRRRYPDLRAVVPTVEGVAEQVRRAVPAWPLPVSVMTGEDQKHQAFAAADVALAASGTVAVELAVAGLPAVIAYRLNPLTGFLAARLLSVDFVSLPNLVLNRQVMPELLQGDCIPARLAAALDRLLGDPEARRTQIEDCRKVTELLGRDGLAPSLRAARALLGLIGTGGRTAKDYNAVKPKEGP